MRSISIRRCQFHFSFFALLAFCCVVTGIEGGAFLFMSVCLHESAHLAAMAIFHALPVKVVFSGFGCRMILSEKHRLSYRQNAVISLAGPLGNLALASVFFVLNPENQIAIQSNLALGILHLLPIEPLDGGLAVHAFLRGKIAAGKADKICLVLSIALLLPLSILGFLILLQTRYNFSLLALSIYLMLYLVLGRNFLPL